MKKTGLILSILLVGGCKQSDLVGPYPQDKPFYIANLTQNVCTEYRLTDLPKVKAVQVRDLPLEAGGPCDRLVGYSRNDWKVIQNWFRDIQAVQK